MWNDEYHNQIEHDKIISNPVRLPEHRQNSIQRTTKQEDIPKLVSMQLFQFLNNKIGRVLI